jgi:hypothetical protein
MHDIFISYAHLDDDSPTGREDGWVTTLKHWLETALKTPLGRKPDIWMDYQLVANAQVTPTLLEEVRGLPGSRACSFAWLPKLRMVPA